MLKVKQKGDYRKAEQYLKNISKPKNFIEGIEKYCNEGVLALMEATPVDSGKTRSSWYYKINTDTEGKIKIQFCNSNVIDYVPIAIILQYGHATRNGGWVEGRDYINPAIRPIFDEITEKIWKEVDNV